MVQASDLFIRAQDWPLPRAALLLADGGIPVFPCQPAGKRPLTEHGFRDATSRAAQVRCWWERFPEANIGVPTGPASGLDVIDVDVRTQGSGFVALEQATKDGLGDGWAMAVSTPSGGMHLYYPTDCDNPNRSWSSGSAHVDFRGMGGYVIVPPSHFRADGEDRQYRVTRVGRSPSPVDAGLLRNRLEPRQAQIGVRQRAPASEPAGIEGRLAKWVAHRGEGDRNTGLFWAACRLAERGHNLDHTLAALAPAAQQTGLSDREITSTVKSAYRRATPALTPFTCMTSTSETSGRKGVLVL